MATINHNVSTVTYPWDQRAVALDAVLQEITLPAWARTVTVFASGAAITLETTGADDAAVGTHYQPIPLNGAWTFHPRGPAQGPVSPQKMYLAGAAATARITYEAAGGE